MAIGLLVAQWWWAVIHKGLHTIHGLNWLTPEIADRATTGWMLGLICTGWYLTIDRIESKKAEVAYDTEEARKVVLEMIKDRGIPDDLIIFNSNPKHAEG